MVAQTAKVNSMLEMTEFVRDWQVSKQFTIDVANVLPADLYTFKPNPEEMSFGEQMVHIAGANIFRFNQIRGSNLPSRSIRRSRLLRTRKRFEDAQSIV